MIVRVDEARHEKTTLKSDDFRVRRQRGRQTLLDPHDALAVDHQARVIGHIPGAIE